MVRARHGSDALASGHAHGGFTQLYRRFPAFLLLFATGVSAGPHGSGILRQEAGFADSEQAPPASGGTLPTPTGPCRGRMRLCRRWAGTRPAESEGTPALEENSPAAA